MGSMQLGVRWDDSRVSTGGCDGMASGGRGRNGKWGFRIKRSETPTFLDSPSLSDFWLTRFFRLTRSLVGLLQEVSHDAYSACRLKVT